MQNKKLSTALSALRSELVQDLSEDEQMTKDIDEQTNNFV